MSSDPMNEGGTPTTTTTPSPDAVQNTEQTGVSQFVPYDRFKEVNDAKKKLENRLEKLEKADKERQEADALAKGEHQKVIDALKPKAERVDVLEATLKEYLEAEIETIPETMRALIPQVDTAAQLKWVKDAKKAGLFKQGAAMPDLDAGVGGDRTPAKVKLTEEQRLMAIAYGVTPEEYVKYLNNKGQTAQPDK